ncbi:unnamed protein product [Gadus morhua 'NCC']
MGSLPKNDRKAGTVRDVNPGGSDVGGLPSVHYRTTPAAIKLLLGGSHTLQPWEVSLISSARLVLRVTQVDPKGPRFNPGIWAVVGGGAGGVGVSGGERGADETTDRPMTQDRGPGNNSRRKQIASDVVVPTDLEHVGEQRPFNNHKQHNTCDVVVPSRRPNANVGSSLMLLTLLFDRTEC